jgi:hypothetical protein
MINGIVNYFWGPSAEPIKDEPSDIATFYKLNKNTGTWDCQCVL